jgi:hypothetical protein
VRDRQHIVRLVGETLREMGLLTVVFAPLDAIFGGTNANLIPLAVIMVIGATLIVCGILIETKTWTRPPKIT